MAVIDLGKITNPAVTGYEEGAGLEALIRTILGAMTVVAGLALLAYFVFGAFRYITSQGDEKAIQQAQRTMTNAVIGLVIVILVTTILAILSNILGFDILRPLYTLTGMFAH